MKEQRERAKADARAKKAGHADSRGYKDLREAGPTPSSPATQSCRPTRRCAASSATALVAPSAEQGETVEVVLEQTRSTPSPVVRSPTTA